MRRASGDDSGGQTASNGGFGRSDPGWHELAERLERDARRRANDSHARSDDEAAWLLLHERVHGYAGVVLRQLDAAWRVDVDDIVQEVVLRLQAPDRLARLRMARAPAGYLAALIRNTALNLVRRDRLRTAGSEPLEWIIPPDTAPDPDDLMLAGDIYERLSPEDRELVELRFWDDLTVQQIADWLGVSYSAAAMRLSRLIRRLREELGHNVPG